MTGRVAQRESGGVSEQLPAPAGRGRRLAVAVLLALGTLLTVAGGVGVWAERQALETDNWVDTSAELLESEPVRSALGLYLVERLYDSDDVESRIAEALPPRLDRLAAPAAAGLKELARRNAPRLLGSAVALDAWRDANRSAHEALLRAVDGGGEGVSLDLSELVAQVAGGTGLPQDVADRLPPDLARLELLPPDELEAARTAVDVLRSLGWVLTTLALAAFAAALLISADRRRTALSLGVCLVVAGIALLALRSLAGRALVEALAEAPNAEGAAGDAWEIATSLLVEVAQGCLLLGVLIVAAAWLAGPGRRATAVRRLGAPALREHPAAARVGLGVLLLLLVIWRPVPWTGRVVPVLLVAVAAYVWLEALRRRSVAELEAAA